MDIQKEMQKKAEDKAGEIWTGVGPSAKWCRKCIHAFKDTQYTVGAEKTNCDMFMPPDDKPDEVLWKNEECPFYEKKEEA